MQEEEMKVKTRETSALERVEAEVKELRLENEELRQYILALQGEVYGARLAAKYLDKELAGRLVDSVCNTLGGKKKRLNLVDFGKYMNS